MTNKAIWVTGMHRTGTSAMMGILRILGVDIGDRIGGKDRWNKKGYLENLDFREFEIKITGQSGFIKIEVPEAELTKRLIKHKKEFQALVKKYNRSPLWGYKGIRSALFPEIFKLIPNIHLIIMVRAPRHSVESFINVRHQMWKRRQLAWKLSAVYQFRLTRFFSRNPQIPYIYVYYDDLVDHTETTMRIIANFIGIKITDDHIRRGNGWIEKGLRHRK